MRQVDQFRRGTSQSGQWFRIGMISATVVTPLLTRWRDLRAAERARALWEARGGGARWPFGASERELPPLARKSDVSTRLWLAGVGFGLIAAGTAAYFIARRRLRVGDEAPLELPLVGSNGKTREAADHATAIFGRAARPVAAETAGGATTLAAQAPRATMPGTRSAGVAGGQEWLGEGEGGREWPGATDGGQEWLAHAPEGMNAQNGAAGVAEVNGVNGVNGVVDAPFIGNIHTRIYHEGRAPNLPDEENRIYFASAAEAEAAGYRAARGEIHGAGA
jgi:hypothetical protein